MNPKLTILCALALAATAADAQVSITESNGWQESAYAKFTLDASATSYNAYVKGSNFSDYTKVDEQLVRNYGTYGRVDVVGLKAGSYTLKIVPVTADGEQTADAVETSSLTVTNYDRQGYAHFNWTGGIGAYNNDGTLKSGAKVLYVTKNTFNTVKCTLISSNKGATTEYTGIGDILGAKQKGFDTTPLAVRIIGEITTSDAAESQRKTDQKGLLLKGKDTSVDMGVTIEGIGEDACFNGFGLGLVDGCDVEVRNLGVMNQDGGNDCMEIKGTQHFWIHNCDYFYGQNDGGDHIKGDGSLDTKDKASYCTLAYNHYHDCGKANLCGMKSEATSNLICYHHNWFDHCDSRNPRVRTSTVHVWNNYYDGVSKYGVGATLGCSIFVEANYFRGTSRPMMSSKQGTDAKGEGTFSGEAGGIIKSYGNYFDKSAKNFSYITYQTNSTSFDAYEATTRNEQVPSSVVTVSGTTSYNNFDTDSKLMYSYTPDAAESVPAKVTGYYGAGRLNGGDLQYDIPDTDDTKYERISELDNLLSSYKTSLKGIFGDENSGSGESGKEDTGDDKGDSGDKGDTPTGDTSICYFIKSTSSTSNSCVKVVTGSYSDGQGSLTYNGTEYKDCVKMESKTEITITPTIDCTITLYFDQASKNLYLDGTKYQTNASKQYSFTATAGKTYTLKKGDSMNLFLITFAGKATGISNVNVDNANAPTYDLMGRRISQPRRGQMFIMNGKKYIKK